MTEKIDKLFDEWEQLSIDAATAAEFHKADRFYEDGIVCDEDFKKGRRVLFILLESHSGKKDVKGRQKFWFRDCVMYPDEFPTGWRGRRYFTRTLLMKQIIEDTEPEEQYYNDGSKRLPQKAFAPLREVAYMNINKAGGKGSSTPWRALKKYVDKCQCMIKREIELIQPRYIVCCSVIVYREICKLFGEDQPCPIIKMWHPSQARLRGHGRITDRKYAQEFQKRWKKQNEDAPTAN
ncbi:MAG: hypothetical protein LBN05_07880 [Oscillospiraceae bacterium]|nr:hypothetical protein [Oscillospiraceae bacterium]